MIAFVGAGQDDPLWPILRASAERYARRARTVELRFSCPPQRSPQAQADVLRGLADSGVRGLCVQVIDPEAVRAPLEQMSVRGVRIVSMMQPVPGHLGVAHVGLDDEAIGQALAQATAEFIRRLNSLNLSTRPIGQTLALATAEAPNDQGSIMVLHARHADPVYSRRLMGFEEILATHPRIEVFASIDAGADARRAWEEVHERSERFPRLSAWVALDDWPIRDVPPGEAVLPPGGKLITFGGTPAHWPLIRAGLLPVVVAADYRDLGYKAVQFCETAIHATMARHGLYTAPVRTVWSADLEDFCRDWQEWSGPQDAEVGATAPSAAEPHR